VRSPLRILATGERRAVLPVSEALRVELAPLAALVRTDRVMRRLATTLGIGPVTAAAFVAALADVSRFRSAPAAA
jgi:transposase